MLMSTKILFCDVIIDSAQFTFESGLHTIVYHS